MNFGSHSNPSHSGVHEVFYKRFVLQVGKFYVDTFYYIMVQHDLPALVSAKDALVYPFCIPRKSEGEFIPG